VFIVYLAALIVGAGTIALQLLLAGHDGAGGHDVADGAGGHDVHAGHQDVDHSGSGFLPIFLSLRFWTFGLMAFGLVGVPLRLFGIVAPYLVPFIAAAMGLACGVFASWSFRALARAATQSGAEAADAVGRTGRVLIPCARGARGKVRIELKGQSVDYLATSEDAALEAGELVLVEEVRDGTVHVSRAPRELEGDQSDDDS
jgi:membrane protein implicated in regulation of membrane protease activity